MRRRGGLFSATLILGWAFLTNRAHAQPIACADRARAVADFGACQSALDAGRWSGALTLCESSWRACENPGAAVFRGLIHDHLGRGDLAARAYADCARVLNREACIARRAEACDLVRSWGQPVPARCAEVITPPPPPPPPHRAPRSSTAAWRGVAWGLGGAGAAGLIVGAAILGRGVWLVDEYNTSPCGGPWVGSAADLPGCANQRDDAGLWRDAGIATLLGAGALVGTSLVLFWTTARSEHGAAPAVVLAPGPQGLGATLRF